MSVYSNRELCDQDNFEWQGGFERVPRRRPRPVTDPPREVPTNSVASPQTVFYCEYWLKNIKAGRFLGGPYPNRRAAVEYAARLLEHTEYEHEVKRVTIVQFRGAGQDKGKVEISQLSPNGGVP